MASNNLIPRLSRKEASKSAGDGSGVLLYVDRDDDCLYWIDKKGVHIKVESSDRSFFKFEVYQPYHGFRIPNQGFIPVSHNGDRWVAASASSPEALHEAFITKVESKNTFIIQQSGFLYVREGHGLSEGNYYYLQSDGTLGTNPDVDYNDVICRVLDFHNLELLDNRPTTNQVFSGSVSRAIGEDAGGSSGFIEIQQVEGVPSNTPDTNDPLVSLDTLTGDLYTWDGSQWNILDTDENIYNSDGTLDEDRVVDGDGNTLTFSNLLELVLTSTTLTQNHTDVDLTADTYDEIIGTKTLTATTADLIADSMTLGTNSSGFLTLSTPNVDASTTTPNSLLQNQGNGVVEFTNFAFPDTLGAEDTILGVSGGELTFVSNIGDTNFALDDLTFDANRTHDLDSNSLTFNNGLGYFLNTTGSSYQQTATEFDLAVGGVTVFNVTASNTTLYNSVIIDDQPTNISSATTLLTRDNTGLIREFNISDLPWGTEFTITDGSTTETIGDSDEITFTTNSTVSDVLDLSIVPSNTVRLAAVDPGEDKYIGWSNNKLTYLNAPSSNLYTIDGTLGSNRTVDGDGLNLSFTNILTYGVSTTDYNLTASDDIDIDATGDYLLNADRVLISSDSETRITGASSLKVVSPNVSGATATTGQVLTLQNAATGEVEFGDIGSLAVSFDIAGDSGTDTVGSGETLTFASADLFTSQITDNQVAYNWDANNLDQGDILYWNGSNMATLSLGSSGQSLRVNGLGTAPSWSTVYSFQNFSVTADAGTDQTINSTDTLSFTSSSDLLETTVGATNLIDVKFVAPTDGDIIYGSSGDYTTLAIGDDDQVLTVIGGVPVWQDATGGTGGVYDSAFADGTVMPNTVGGYEAGTDVADLDGDTLSQMWDGLLFPAVLAYISDPVSASLVEDIVPTIVEIGTALQPQLTASFDRGDITNGDGTTGPALVGLPNTYSFSGPGISGTNEVSTTALSTAITPASSAPAAFGNNVWTVEIDYGIGTGTYTDNFGNAGSNLDPSRVADSITVNSPATVGRRYAFHGTEANPQDSADVRALADRDFLDSNNEGTFDIDITAGDTEIAFAIPSGKNATVLFVESSNADVTSSFSVQTFLVEDANGDSTNYKVFYATLAGSGYGTNSTYRVIVN